ncbi:hypothetical protein AB0D57_45870 [Streptomyces sp. NPDC048275]|uniref:hypothetical protein n=1 Tax=Streptomyces sp. NPDC048275 TaxID=3155629 RepID=UPI0033E79795
MSRRGRKAVLPPAGHRTEPPLAPGGFVVTVTNKAGYGKAFDFTGLPVAGPVQCSLAAAFAAQSRGWTCHKTAASYWARIRVFAAFLSGLEDPPEDLDALTAATMRDWRERHIGTNTGRGTLTTVRLVLRRDPRLTTGPVAEELARRIPRPTPSKQPYGQAERDRVVLAAQRQFRAAWLRIGENTRLLNTWREGGDTEGSHEWKVGRILDHLARTGDVPLTVSPSGRVQATYYTLLGGRGVEMTWGRLFPTRGELTALAVLLTDRFGWNLSLYDRLPAPTAAPSAGGKASVTYQVQIEKHRAGGGRWFSTENITDSGADSPGRLITQALEVTAHARALANYLKPGTDFLMAAHAYQRNQQHRHLDRPAPLGPLAFGVSERMAQRWAHNHKLGGSPFQRARRTTVTDQGRPLQHTRGTHESVYVLPDRRVQRASREAFVAGALEAMEQARTVVFGGKVTDRPNPDHQQTATVDCQDEETSPWPAPEGGCAADFLLCLACPNAHVHPGHHPRLAHLHQQILSLRSVLDDDAFGDLWSAHLHRLQDLRGRIGPAAWSAALARVTDTDRNIVKLLANKDLAP